MRCTGLSFTLIDLCEQIAVQRVEKRTNCPNYITRHNLLSSIRDSQFYTTLPYSLFKLHQVAVHVSFTVVYCGARLARDPWIYIFKSCVQGAERLQLVRHHQTRRHASQQLHNQTHSHSSCMASTYQSFQRNRNMNMTNPKESRNVKLTKEQVTQNLLNQA